MTEQKYDETHLIQWRARWRTLDPRWAEYNSLTVRRPGLKRPPRRNGERPLPSSVGGMEQLAMKEPQPWKAKTQGWAQEQIGLGIERCPATYGDHQWPTIGLKVRFRFGWTAL